MAVGYLHAESKYGFGDFIWCELVGRCFFILDSKIALILFVALLVLVAARDEHHVGMR